MSAVNELIAVNVQHRDELKAEITADRVALGEARKQIKVMEKDLEAKESRLERTDEYIKELKSGGRKKGGAGAVKKKAVPRKRNVNGEDVIEACVKAVSENPGMHRQELEPFVGEKLIEKDLGMRAYDKRFSEAMKKDLFTITAEDKVYLSEALRVVVNDAGSIPLNGAGELPVESLTESMKVD